MLSRYLYSSRIDEVSIFPRTVLDSRIAWSHPSSGVGVPKASLRRKGPTLKLSPFVLRLLRKPMVKVRAIYRIVPQPCLDCQYSSASCDAMKNASDEDEVGTRRTTMRHVRFTWSAWTGQQSVGGIAGARDCWLVGLVVGVLVLVALHVTGLVRQILAPCDSLAFSGLVEALLVGARVFADVRQSVHCGGCLTCLEVGEFYINWYTGAGWAGFPGAVDETLRYRSW